MEQETIIIVHYINILQKLPSDAVQERANELILEHPEHEQQIIAAERFVVTGE